MITFNTVEATMDEHDVHTILEHGDNMLLLFVRGVKHVTRWSMILNHEPAYPCEPHTVKMPIALWFIMEEDLCFQVITDTVKDDLVSTDVERKVLVC